MPLIKTINFLLQHKYSHLVAFYLAINTLMPIVTLVTQASADNNLLRTQQIKSAYIFNIARYVSWPTLSVLDEHAIIKLCFLKTNPFNSAINSIKNKTFISSSNKKVKMVIKIIPDLEKKHSCQILYLTQKQNNMIFMLEKNQAYKQQHLISSQTTLVISDTSDPSFLSNQLESAMINLTRKGLHLGININTIILDKSQLKLSSQLLKLSHKR